MSDLIRTPDSAWGAFWRGFGLALLTFEIPLAIRIALMTKTWAEGLIAAGWTTLVVCAIAIIAGFGFAVRALLYKWAYERATGQAPFG